MTDTKVFEQLVAAIFHVLARSAIPIATVRELIGTEKNRQAYNLCNGINTQKEISRHLRIDQGQLSKTFKRWIEAGIAIRIGDPTESRLLHIFPVPREKAPSGKPGKPRRRATRRR